MNNALFNSRFYSLSPIDLFWILDSGLPWTWTKISGHDHGHDSGGVCWHMAYGHSLWWNAINGHRMAVDQECEEVDPAE